MSYEFKCAIARETGRFINSRTKSAAINEIFKRKGSKRKCSDISDVLKYGIKAVLCYCLIDNEKVIEGNNFRLVISEVESTQYSEGMICTSYIEYNFTYESPEIVLHGEYSITAQWSEFGVVNSSNFNMRLPTRYSNTKSARNV